MTDHERLPAAPLRAPEVSRRCRAGREGGFALISLRTLCFLRRDNRVLLLHRRNPPNAGYWNGVGGKLEPGEDPFTACIREVREETSLTIRDPQLRVLLVATVRSTAALWIIFVFSAAAPKAAPIPSQEGELAWVEMDKLAALPVLPDLPLLLRHLDGEAVTVIRMELETEDATSLSRVEVLGSLPPFFSQTLNN